MIGTKSPSIQDKLDALFSKWNRSDTPGLAVGVRKDGTVIYRCGFGMASLESCVAINTHTRMRIGSTSKHFTALLALLLAEDGKIDLDIPIRANLPELVGAGGDPTIRQLLQHRGGSRCYLDLGFIAHGGVLAPRGTALAVQAAQTQLNFPAEEAMVYSNGGYHLVSIAIERAGGSAFEQQLKDRLFDPLGMADTEAINSDYAISPRMATLHLPAAGGRWRRGLLPSEEVLGEGAIVSTVEDMLTWMAHLRSQDRFGTPLSWRALVDPPRYKGGQLGRYALGLMLGSYRGSRIIHHAGAVPGGLSQMITFPNDGLDIVILCNGAPGASPVELAERIADVVLDETLGPREEFLMTAPPYEPLLGQWYSADTGMVYGLRDNAGELALTICGASAGLPLSASEDGCSVCSTPSLGDIILRLEAASEGAPLVIQFGETSSAYSKLENLAPRLEKFAEIVVGKYDSIDGQCTAIFRLCGEKLFAIFQDDIGHSEVEITPLSDRVALAGRDLGGAVLNMALNFHWTDSGIAGFDINTARTRHLGFRRSDA